MVFNNESIMYDIMQQNIDIYDRWNIFFSLILITYVNFSLPYYRAVCISHKAKVI